MVKFKVFLLIMYVVVKVQSGPIIIKSAINKNQGQNQNHNVFDEASHKGIANFEGEEGFNKDDQQKYISAHDSEKFNENTGQIKDHAEHQNFNDEKYHQNGGGSIGEYGNKIGHKKGHHKKGFHKSYHKDETGSDSSYFDDGSDEGDEYVYNTKKDAYGDVGQQSHRAGNVNAEAMQREQGKNAYYDNGEKYEKNNADARDYKKKNYYDGRQENLRKNAADLYDEGGRYQQEKYTDYQRPYNQQYYTPNSDYNYNNNNYYYEKEPYYRRPQSSITIYEDPRYIDEYRPRYQTDYADLDFKRPINNNRFYNRRPNYDYY